MAMKRRLASTNKSQPTRKTNWIEPRAQDFYLYRASNLPNQTIRFKWKDTQTGGESNGFFGKKWIPVDYSNDWFISLCI